MKNDFALMSLVMLAQYHGVPLSSADVKYRYDPENSGMTVEAWLLAAKKSGLKAKYQKKNINKLHTATLPLLVWDDSGEHFILAGVDNTKKAYLIHDFRKGRVQTLTENEFEVRYSGNIIQVTSRASTVGNLAKFDFSWFVPIVIKYRNIFAEVIAASIALQIFALVTPLFFQVVMDKVLVHRGFDTLNVIVLSLSVVVIFEIILGGLRTYIFAHTTSRIDVELGAKLFRHMLALPLSYFSARRVGDTVARIRELEQIRNFLTGQALTSLLDLMFSFFFIVFMWYYSDKLTVVILMSIPCYIMWSVLISPILKKRLDNKFARNAENQSFLVEAVTAINTVKAMAISPQMTLYWDKLLSAYVKASLSVTVLACVGQQGIQLIQKAVMIITLWLGAHLVIDGKLTIGQLIAFNMLAGQVTAPVLRLSQLWQDFQQIGISVARLGDILNLPTEDSANKLIMPKIVGSIELKQINFRYKPDTPLSLENIDLKIGSGEIIGIVGRSGSGKSTFTKLLQKLYVPESGQILIDGYDISIVDPSSLRRQIGVVQQDNILLNRSIRDNIALSLPGISMERVVEAAKLAGAHQFISELTEGYNTIVGEQGASLSGGQRQRIAIARALISDPRILIFDEATSALDYESESIIIQNMKNICSNRTVIIIAHRLSTVKMADRIVVMDKGKVAEIGTHDELMTNPVGIYHYLHELQSL
ncbi:type I secretion system permease/ATPase [Citrobacter werkmanii]|uniref:type I secretion system permease/ATPase n=1 Tax=Citrobacter werkmanii TaxID=67827 RepID=UPI001289B5F0|nr:type I secretion system permease/ATPase [Salmonella enterica]EAZ9261384.1 type I secretion system permease/ATPase [Salmonella enterica]EBN2521029.1 type I secretion system permease/ATPase [Salmonella enterica]